MLAILAAALLAAAPQHDTVFMADGGRVVGTVIEEAPQGVTVQLADGTVRRYPARDVLRIEYSDGSASAQRRADAPAVPAPPSAPPPPQAYSPPPSYQQPPSYPPPPAYRPPPSYPPPAYQPPAGEPAPYAQRPYRAQPPYRTYPPAAQGGYQGARSGMGPASPVYAVLGLGGLSLSGELEKGVSASRAYEPQLDIYTEAGLRLDPAIALALYADLGVGDPSSEIRATCRAAGTTCTASTGRLGILLRHTFTPFAPSAPWIAAGTGIEFGSVTADASSGGSSNLFNYTGWEALRLMAGVDFRSNPLLGFGLYGGVSFGRYTQYEDALGSVDLGNQPYHTTVEAGVRMTLFP